MFVNEYVDRLNSMWKKDYYNLVNKCERMSKYYASYYDVITFLNEYMYSLNDTVDSNYFMAVCELEDYYHSKWMMELN